MSVIDLDRPAVASVPPRRTPHLIALAALTAGFLIGGAVTYGWNLSRQNASREREVSVFVVADASRFLDGSVVVNGRVASVTLTRRITLINAGPAPVNIHNLAADRPGVTLRGVEKQRWVDPGATVQADADLRVDCARGLPLGRIPVTLSVQTLDERSRESQPKDVLDGTPWGEQAEVACAGKGVS